MDISEIEDAVASGEMTAAQCFTQMRQHCKDTTRLDWILECQSGCFYIQCHGYRVNTRKGIDEAMANMLSDNNEDAHAKGVDAL